MTGSTNSETSGESESKGAVTGYETAGKDDEASTESHFDVHFVIPHRGRTDYLAKTVESIAKLKTDHSVFLSVVTQDNVEEIEHLIQAATDSPKSILSASSWCCEQAERSLTISALRNIGARHTESTYLAFLDADVYLAENWLEVCLEELNETAESGKRRAIVSAHQKPSSIANSLEHIRVALSNPHVDCAVDFLPGRNLLMRREDCLAIGGFPEHLETCEDYFFTDLAAKRGPLWYSAQTSYIHLGEDRHYKELFKKEIWRAKGNLASLKGRSFSLRELPSLLVPVWIGLFFVIALACLILGYTFWFWAGITLTALPFALYTYRLHRLAPHLRLSSIIRFYLHYFPARLIGMVS